MMRLRFAPITAALCLLAFPVASLADTHEAEEKINLRLIADGLTAPVDLVEIPDGSGRLLVADQAGLVHLLHKDGSKPQTFLDLRDRLVSLREGFDERGLLGIALHPEVIDNRRFFIYYSAPLRECGAEGFDHTSHVSEFRVEADFARADPGSEKHILQVDQPQFNHDGGSILFGPDGFLYISLGDGGAAHDRGEGHPELGNGQDVTTLLGAILRLDIDGEAPYSIPGDNPFVGKEGRDEIFAYGLRNAWGLSFDTAGGGDLFAADVGQFLFEEVNIIEKGGNYGWNIREGLHCFDAESPRDPPEDCPGTGAQDEPLIDPIVEYKNRNGFQDDPDAYGICVIGGHRYRGEALPHLHGRYIFGDWSRQWGQAGGILLQATAPGDDLQGRWTVERLETIPYPDGRMKEFLLGIGRDADGELYLLTSKSQAPTGKTGKILKLVPLED